MSKDWDEKEMARMQRRNRTNYYDRKALENKSPFKDATATTYIALKSREFNNNLKNVGYTVASYITSGLNPKLSKEFEHEAHMARQDNELNTKAIKFFQDSTGIAKGGNFFYDTIAKTPYRSLPAVSNHQTANLIRQQVKREEEAKKVAHISDYEERLNQFHRNRYGKTDKVHTNTRTQPIGENPYQGATPNDVNAVYLKQQATSQEIADTLKRLSEINQTTVIKDDKPKMKH